MKRFVWIILVLAVAAPLRGQITWTRCQQSAREHYPLIRQYRLVEQSTEYSVANAAKAWLPQVSFAAQGSYQSDVASFPEEMTAMYRQLGIDMKGLNRDQYRLSLEVSQTLWDGGLHRAQQEVAKADGEFSRQNLEVEMYALRERVNNLYFGILMLREQLTQNTLLQELLQSNLRTVDACIEHGAATASDRQAVQVELLAAAQQRVHIESANAAYRRMLSVMTGIPVGGTDTLETPDIRPVQPALAGGNRPELHLFEAQRQQFEAQKRALRASVMPRLGLFAQGFYGNPGLNLFKDMTENRWTWNYLAGIRFQWNFGSLYTQKGSLQKLSLAQRQVDSRREVFLFNQNLKTIRQREAIDKMNRIMADDAEIIALRTSIRRTSETRFTHGTLTVSDLLRDIHAESQARQARALHEIEWIKNICDLLDTINEPL
ncbi:MAG: TolC family protein [Tannerella sp.]|jgi:outer membrane protein TolC|nr:TolC family protein [Tannerella sp.]